MTDSPVARLNESHKDYHYVIIQNGRSYAESVRRRPRMHRRQGHTTLDGVCQIQLSTASVTQWIARHSRP